MFNPLDYPICFATSERNCISAWREHVPFAMFLVEAIKPQVFVELGTHHGQSYCSVCQAVKMLCLGTSCFAVDTWQGDPHAGEYGPEVLENLRRHHDPLYSGFSTLLRMTFDEAVEQFADGSIDLLHIDGFHTYEAVRHDFQTWLPKMSKKGVMILHDINVRERAFGVWKFWDEIRGQYPHFEFIHGHGLGVLGTGEIPSEIMKSFFEATNDEAARLRAFFYQLGRQISLSNENDELVAEQKSLKSRLRNEQTLAAEIQDKAGQIQSLTTDRDQLNQQVQALTTARGQQDEATQALATARDQQDETIQALTTARDQQNAQIEALSKKVGEHEQHITATYRDLERQARTGEARRREILTSRREIQARDHEILVKNREIEAKSADLCERERTIEALSRQLEAGEIQIAASSKLIQSLAVEMETLKASKAWKASRALQKTREATAPLGSIRYRALRLAYRGMIVWRREGFPSFVGKGARKATRIAGRIVRLPRVAEPSPQAVVSPVGVLMPPPHLSWPANHHWNEQAMPVAEPSLR